MNVPSVEDNPYVRSLRNRDIPYDIRTSTCDTQNSKTKKPNTVLSTLHNQNSQKKKKPDTPPRCSSLTTNHKPATANWLAQLPNDRKEFFTSAKTFRQRSPTTTVIGPEQINWTYDPSKYRQDKWEILTDTWTRSWCYSTQDSIYTPTSNFHKRWIGLLQIISSS